MSERRNPSLDLLERSSSGEWLDILLNDSWKKDWQGAESYVGAEEHCLR